jgi:hypothetical protein
MWCVNAPAMKRCALYNVTDAALNVLCGGGLLTGTSPIAKTFRRDNGTLKVHLLFSMTEMKLLAEFLTAKTHNELMKLFCFISGYLAESFDALKPRSTRSQHSNLHIEGLEPTLIFL